MSDQDANEVPVPGQSANTKSWFGLWSGNPTSSNPPQSSRRSHPSIALAPESPESDRGPSGRSSQSNEASQTDRPVAAQSDSKTKEEVQRSSGWAFWSKATPGPSCNASSTAPDAKKENGELAVAGTSSQSKPEAVQLEQKNAAKASNEGQLTPRGRAASTARAEEPKSKLLENPVRFFTPSSSPTPSGKRAEMDTAASSALKQQNPNLVLPSFKDTYPIAPSLTFWQNVSRYITNQQRNVQLHKDPSPPKPKRALAVGVHGYFPAPIVQKLLGQPTGTSVRFANGAAAAMSAWAERHGYAPEIEKIALEGEGVVKDRVDALWKLLLNWQDKIKKADFIMVACHSQGVPVATMLLAKLISSGYVGPNVRLGVCAMAGVNLGPFRELQSNWYDRSARELFEFANATSEVSQMYEKALKEVLRRGTRIVYAGSIDDQLVPLEVSVVVIKEDHSTKHMLIRSK